MRNLQAYVMFKVFSVSHRLKFYLLLLSLYVTNDVSKQWCFDDVINLNVESGDDLTPAWFLLVLQNCFEFWEVLW